MWLEAPMDCKTRKEKDNLILNTINILEQNVKIN